MTKKHKEKKIDMAEHEYNVRVMGISERAKKIIVRLIIFGVPVLLLAYYIIKAIQQ